MNDKVKIAVVDNDIDKAAFPDITFQDIMFGIADQSQYHATFVVGIIIDQLKKHNTNVEYTNSGAYIMDLFQGYETQSKKAITYLNNLSENLLDHNFINCSFAVPSFAKEASSLNITKWKNNYLQDNDIGLVVTGAGNNEMPFPGATFLPQNILYSLNIGAFYKKNHRFQNTHIVHSDIFETSKPSASVMFAENGLQESYNTLSEKDHVLAFYYAKQFKFGGFFQKDNFSEFPEGTAKFYKRVKKYVMGGTSFAAPATVGLFAKAILDNPEKKLSKHDLINIALHASYQPYAKRLSDGWEDKKFSSHVRTYKQNMSNEKNGQGYGHALEFGFGAVHHKHFQNLVKSWVKTTNDIREIKPTYVSKATNDQGHYVYTFRVDDDFRVQQIQVNYKGIDTSNWGLWTKNKYVLSDLQMLKVVSPSGSESFIYDKKLSPSSCKNFAAKNIDEELKGVVSKIFSQELYGVNKSVQLWGEKKTKGQWKIVSNCELDVQKTQLTIIADYSKDNHYSYDDNILNVKEPVALTDLNGGHDTVYFTNYTNGKVHVKKSAGEIDFMSRYGSKVKTVKIAKGTTIENYVFGPMGGRIFE